MATTQHLTPPERVYNSWRDEITAFSQVLNRLREKANTYEQRIGADYFNLFKYPNPLPDSPEQEANNDIQWLSDQTLEMVNFFNRLDAFMDAANLAVLGRQRTDL